MELLDKDKQKMVDQVPAGAIFRHYKGKEYKILHLARDSEHAELVVVYQGLYRCEHFGDYPIWVRPLKEFLETVEIDGITQPRFSLTHQPIHE